MNPTVAVISGHLTALRRGDCGLFLWERSESPWGWQRPTLMSPAARSAVSGPSRPLCFSAPTLMGAGLLPPTCISLRGLLPGSLAMLPAPFPPFLPASSNPALSAAPKTPFPLCRGWASQERR